MVEKNAAVLDGKGLKKAAMDLAEMLDHEGFAVNMGARRYEVSEMASVREEIFNAFCAVFAQADIELPVLEPVLYEAFLPEEPKKDEIAQAMSFSHSVKDRVKGRSKEAKMLRAMAEIATVFAKDFANEYRGVSSKAMTAKANAILVGMGLDPIRPDYVSTAGKISTDEIGPAKELLVLVVDDEIKSIAKSLQRLAGWKNLKFAFCHIKRKEWGDKTSREDRLKTMVENALSLAPDIILMDQGIDQDIEGSDLTLEIKRMLVKKAPIIVPNTGGLPDKLIEAGAIPVNFEKGGRRDAIVTALKYL